MLRLAVLGLLTLLVSAVMLTAGAIVRLLTYLMWPFCWIQNTANWFLEGLIRELWRPGG